MKTTIFAPCTTCIKTAVLPSTNVSVEEPEDEEVDFMTYWIMRFEDEMFTAPIRVVLTISKQRQSTLQEVRKTMDKYCGKKYNKHNNVLSAV